MIDISKVIDVIIVGASKEGIATAVQLAQKDSNINIVIVSKDFEQWTAKYPLLENIHRIQQIIDAAAVYVNASTRFTDGFEFGYGAEIGISTQKLHARGPMGLLALTTTKYVIYGSGQIRS